MLDGIGAPAFAADAGAVTAIIALFGVSILLLKRAASTVVAATEECADDDDVGATTALAFLIFSATVGRAGAGAGAGFGAGVEAFPAFKAAMYKA